MAGSTLPKCVRIVSINTPLNDLSRAHNNFGITADKKGAFLNNQAAKFRMKPGGFLEEKGAVSIESVSKPGYFLRHKNYNFRLEKERASSMFCK